MIIDTSALMSVLLEEPDAKRLFAVMAEASECRISAGNWVELGAVISSRPGLHARLEELISLFKVTIAPVDVEQARAGHRAYREFGKGNHPAKLNLGDCFAYALSKATGEPLLFKGNDFSQTDVAQAL